MEVSRVKHEVPANQLKLNMDQLVLGMSGSPANWPGLFLKKLDYKKLEFTPHFCFHERKRRTACFDDNTETDNEDDEETEAQEEIDMSEKRNAQKRKTCRQRK